MFNFSSIFSLLTAAPAVIGEVEAVATTVYAEYEKLAADPAVIALENLIATHFTHTVTPGAAVIVEPISATPGTSAALGKTK